MSNKKPLFFISPTLLATIGVLGAGYAALHAFLNKEWGRGRHDWSEE